MKIIIILKTRYASSCVVNFYSAGVVTRDRRIGSSFSSFVIFDVKGICGRVLSVGAINYQRF
jgi:hypothetical protein